MKKGTRQAGSPKARDDPLRTFPRAVEKCGARGSGLRHSHLPAGCVPYGTQGSCVPENRALATAPVFLMVAPIISYANISNM